MINLIHRKDGFCMNTKNFKVLCKTFGVAITSVFVMLMLILSSNSNEVYAFGGTVNLSISGYGNYNATNRCQVNVAWDSSSNLVVTGYQYFSNVQDYLKKGNTHKYELVFAGKTYADTEAAGLNFTVYNGLSGSKINEGHLHYLGETQGAGYNYILKEVSFRFVIPKNDIANLSDGDYNFQLKSYLYNVRLSGSINTKRTATGVTTKLAPTNLSASTLLSDKNITSSSGMSSVTASVKSTMSQTMRVNATSVLTRTSASKSAGQVSGLYYITRPNVDADTQKFYKITGSKVDSSGLSNLLTWASYNINVTNSYSVNLTKEQLFTKYPDLKTQYNNAYSKYNSAMSSAKAAEDMLNKTDNIAKKAVYLSQLSTYQMIANKQVTIMNNILAKCNNYTSVTSTSTVTNYTCSLFLEGNDYGVSVSIKNAKAQTRYLIQIYNSNGTLYKQIDCGKSSAYNKSSDYTFKKTVTVSDIPVGTTLDRMVIYGYNGREHLYENKNYKNKNLTSHNISYTNNWCYFGEVCIIKMYYTNTPPTISFNTLTYNYDEAKKFTTNETTAATGENYVNIVQAMIKSVNDKEDGKRSTWSAIKSTNPKVLSIKNKDDNSILTKSFYDKVMPVGTYEVTFQVTDKGGLSGQATGTIKIIESPIPTIYTVEKKPQSYLQGTDITNDMLKSAVRIYDKVTNENLTFTTATGVLKQGYYRIVSKGGLDSNKVTNYTYDYYINHKEECDEENTYTLKVEYCGKGMDYNAKVITQTKVTIIPAFPEFGCQNNNMQIHEGYMPVRDANGKITDFTNKIGISDLTNQDFYGLYAKSYIDGDKKFKTENVTNTIKLSSVKYADGSVVNTNNYIITSNGTYGNDLKGTKNDDGTFTLSDGSIYPYRGKISFVVEATNKFGNSRLSSDKMTSSSTGDNNKDDDTKDKEDFNIIIKPITDPIITGNNRYMYVTEEITLENLLKKLKAKDFDANGNEIDITDNIVIGKVDKYDEYDNFIGTIFNCEDKGKLFNGGALQPKLDEKTGNLNFNEVLNTDKKCGYKITFYIKNESNRVSSFEVIMRVVDGSTKRPYTRWTDLKYAIKIPENLDENGNNIYYDTDSIWMNDKSAYEELMYSLVTMELTKEDACDDADVICRWYFSAEDGKVIKSWQMDTGIADAGNTNGIAEGTVVQGYMFKDSEGKMYIVHDNPTGRMYHTYIKEDSYQRGMLPGTALNDKLYDTFYEKCCLIDNTKVAYQGNGSWAIIRDEEGNYLYCDKATGKRMVSADNTLTNVWEDTRDYSKESIWVYGLKTKINVLYKEEFDNNPNLALCLRVLDTIENFKSNTDLRLPEN